MISAIVLTQFSTGVGDNEPTVTAPPDEEAIARIVFYALSSLPLILYLTVAMTVIVHR